MKSFKRNTTAETRVERTFVDKATRRQVSLTVLVLSLLILLLAGFRWIPPIPVPSPARGPDPAPTNDELTKQEKGLKSQEAPAIHYRSRAVVGVPTPPQPEWNREEGAAKLAQPQPAHSKKVESSTDIAEQVPEGSDRSELAESNLETPIEPVAETADMETKQESQSPPPISVVEPPPSVTATPSDHENSAVESGALAEKDQPVDDAPIGVVNQQDGTMAPQYTLDSINAYKRMAARHQGLFVAYDGVIFIQIGRSLEPRYARCEWIGKDQLRNYAPRMAPLPVDHPQVRQLHSVIRQRRTDLKPQFQIMLALPWSYDAEILRAQLAYCNEHRIKPTGRLVTTGRFVETMQNGRVPEFRITSVQSAGGVSNPLATAASK